MAVLIDECLFHTTCYFNSKFVLVRKEVSMVYTNLSYFAKTLKSALPKADAQQIVVKSVSYISEIWKLVILWKQVK